MSTAAADPKSLKTFAEFYPFYLSEHSNRTCRRLHFLGSTLALVCLAMLLATGRMQYLLYGLLCGYDSKNGGVALFAGNNSDGAFANLRITPTSQPGCISTSVTLRRVKVKGVV